MKDKISFMVIALMLITIGYVALNCGTNDACFYEVLLGDCLC